MTVLEICVDDVAGARDAEASGADRIELCVGLAEGGLTPGLGLVRTVLSATSRMQVQVILRPRGGDFVYDDDEVAVVLAEAAAMADLGASRLGLVVGALTPDGRIDTDTTAALVAAAGGAPVTFHKAFDQVTDRAGALAELVGLGVTRVLTSGGQPSARAGIVELAALVDQAAGRIEVMAGGGVRADHVHELVQRTGVPAVHLRAMREVPSASRHRPTAMSYDSGTRLVTSGPAVARVRAELDRPSRPVRPAR